MYTNLYTKKKLNTRFSRNNNNKGLQKLNKLLLITNF